MRFDKAAVEGVGDANCCITTDLDAGCWQVNMKEASKENGILHTTKREETIPLHANGSHKLTRCIRSHGV
jgi:hypothetical protein